MTLDEVVRRMRPNEPDRKSVERLVNEVLAAAGIGVDEATGTLVAKTPAAESLVPQQSSVWHSGMRGRRAGRR